jgi:glycosyltransferase involved in cell wall biosynthesis
MINDFLAAGCEILVLGEESESIWADYFAEKGIEYIAYPLARNGLNPLQDIQTKAALKRILRAQRPDKVFTYQAKPNIYGCLAAHEAGVPDIFIMIAGLGIFSAMGLRARLVRTIIKQGYRRAMRHAAKVFFQNADDLQTLAGLGVVKPSQAVLVRGSGVNVTRFAEKPLPDKPAFLFLGRLLRSKGVFEYLEACRMVKAKNPCIDCHLVGPFDANQDSLSPADLQPYIDDGTVEFFGEQEDVRPYLERCSVFVLPSYYGEGIPKSALEAMATGRALIMADTVGCREVIIERKNGILVPPRDTKALAECMERLINDRPQLDSMAKASRTFAEDIFNVELVNDVIMSTMGIDSPRLAQQTIERML